MIKKRAVPAGGTGTKKAAQPGGVRITVEQDNDHDADEESEEEEEVQDIGSAASTATSSSEAEEEEASSAAKGKPQKMKKKKLSDASGTAGLANVLRGLLAAKPATVATAAAAADPAAAPGCPILAKALTDRQRFKASGGGGADKDADAEAAAAVVSVQRRRRLVALRRRWLCTGRVKPAGRPGEREAERELERTACRGVVQLFNAVRAQQRTLEARLAGKSEAGRQRVLGSLSKAEFLDMLAGRKQKAKSKSGGIQAMGLPDGEDDDEEEEAANGSRSKRKKKASWGVLSDDYLVKPTLTMKDWDRDSSSAEEGEQQTEGDGQQAMEED